MRRLAFCLTIAPMLIVFAIIMTSMVPLLAFFAWMQRNDRPWGEAWKTVWDLPRKEIREGWAMAGTGMRKP